MANSVFTPIGGRDQYHGGTFRAEDVRLGWTGGGDGDGALVQEAQWRCARQVSILYEIGSPAVYYVGNRRSGNAQFRRVVGGPVTFAGMARTFGDICKPENLIIDAVFEGCENAINIGQRMGVKYTCVDATLNDLGASVAADSVVINESMSFVFVDLYYEDM